MNVNLQDDGGDSADEGSKSIDSDIAKEYNLDGETITHYSDDDVPADNCRASETEHSDSEDECSDLADFVVDESEEEDEGGEENEQDIEDEEDSDDSVFEHNLGKSTKVTRPGTNIENLNSATEEEEDDDEEKQPEEPEKQQSPSKVKETRRSPNCPTKVVNSGQENKIKEQEIEIQSQERKIQDMETDIQEREMQIEAEEKSPDHERKFKVNLCSESESENSTDKIIKNAEARLAKSPVANVSLIDENKENSKISKKLKKKKEKEGSKAEETKVSKSEKQKKNKNLEVEDQKLKKRKPGDKFPVACSTRYEASSDSEDEPETLSFADARNEAVEVSKKESESIKADKALKKKKKKGHVEESKVANNSGNIKRLPDELIEDLEDVPRPKKRQKVSKQNDFTTPSLGMHDRRYSVASKSKSVISASDCGSTTDFEVMSLQKKEKKLKAQSSLALKWFKQRMIARNIRQPISVYLSQQQKRRAAGKDLF